MTPFKCSLNRLCGPFKGVTKRVAFRSQSILPIAECLIACPTLSTDHIVTQRTPTLVQNLTIEPSKKYRGLISNLGSETSHFCFRASFLGPETVKTCRFVPYLCSVQRRASGVPVVSISSHFCFVAN